MDQHRHAMMSPDGLPTAILLPLVVLAPLRQQRRIRSLLRLAENGVNDGMKTVGCEFLTTPIKAPALYNTLTRANHGEVSLENLSAQRPSRPPSALTTDYSSAHTPRLDNWTPRLERRILTLASEPLSLSSATTTSSSLQSGLSPSSHSASLSSSISSILVVEDNVVNQKILKQMLSRLGFHSHQLMFVHDGRQGVTAAVSYYPARYRRPLAVPNI